MTKLTELKKAINGCRNLPPLLEKLTVRERIKGVPQASVTRNSFYNTESYMVRSHHKALSKTLKNKQ